ncbi:hypothetical protein SDJN03_18736, partial [Cucurbita argyrosperma subsp. sororia]
MLSTVRSVKGLPTVYTSSPVVSFAVWYVLSWHRARGFGTTEKHLGSLSIFFLTGVSEGWLASWKYLACRGSLKGVSPSEMREF